jgi:hypothetical protein
MNGTDVWIERRAIAPRRARWAVLAALPAMLGLTGCQTMDRVSEDFDRAVAEVRHEVLGPVDPIALPPAQRPAYTPGQVFVYNRDRLRRVASVRDGEIQWRDRDGPVFRSTEHFFMPRTFQDYRNRTVRREFTGDPGAIWPLALGKAVEFTELRTTERKDTGAVDETTRRWRCEVDDARVTETLAGAFDTFRVTCRSYREGFRSVRRLNPIQVVRWDYAPQIGHYVRRESWSPRSNRRNVRTLSAAMPAALATPQRINALMRRLASDGA